MKRLLLTVSFWSAFAGVSALFAAPVTSVQAEKAVGSWLKKGGMLDRKLGRTVESSHSLSTTNGAAFHIVRLDHGFVVTSGDTKLEPVIAYSTGASFDECEANPLYVLVRNDVALRAAAAGVVSSGSQPKLLKAAMATPPVSAEQTAEERKWAELLEEEEESDPQTSGLFQSVCMAAPSVPDVRVEPFLRSTWGQSTVGGKNVYNRFTPNNYVCGCVATAGAQIMRYHEWPRSSMAQYTCIYCKVDGQSRQFTTQAGLYDWAHMPLSPTSSIADTEREAIGRLTSDIGICCGMAYTSGSSGTGGYMLARALKNNFGYSNAIAMTRGGGCSTEETKNALLSNLDAGLPVMVSIKGGSGGHAIVGDGYGYSDETLYYHFNMGWDGSENVWYAPPDLNTDQFYFNTLEGFVYNIYTNGMANAVICSGRVLSSSGAPAVGATVEARQNDLAVQTRTTNDKGIYAFILPAGSYVIAASKSGSSNSRGVTLSACVALSLADGSDFGKYYSSPDPQVGNRCEQDIVLNGLASAAEPSFSPVGGLFYPSTNIVITCSTEGAVIRYTLDGSDPTESSTVYSGPIFIEEDVTIKARAFKDGMNPSAVVTQTYSYDASQGAPKGDYFDNPIDISGSSGERVISGICNYSLEDDEPKHTLLGNSYSLQYQSVWFRWTAPGSGTMTFTTSCTGGYLYPTAVAVYEGDSITAIERLAMSKDYTSSGDYATSVDFAVEQGRTYRIVGVTTYDTSSDGTASFTFTWSGELETAAEETPVTGEVPIPVRYDWLATYYPSAAVSDYAELVKTIGANGRAIWQSYLLGLNPTDPSSDFRITSISFVNGVPTIETNVDSNWLEDFGYECVIKGTDNLSTGPWTAVTSGHRYYKAVVARP